MPKYRLNINFSEKDLETIYTCKQRVVIVKHTEEEKSKVAWVSFKPFEKNTIDWSTNFAIYASSCDIQGGAQIKKLSDADAVCQVNYTFENGYFRTKAPDSSIGANTYEITNGMPENDYLTFGLAQSVSVNGTAYNNNPINAILVPRGQLACMTPIEKVDVFLEAHINNSTVLSRISSQKIQLEYSGDVTALDISYDSQKGGFYPANE